MFDEHLNSKQGRLQGDFQGFHFHNQVYNTTYLLSEVYFKWLLGK